MIKEYANEVDMQISGHKQVFQLKKLNSFLGKVGMLWSKHSAIKAK